jgi:protein O-GlcNAc transferase
MEAGDAELERLSRAAAAAPADAAAQDALGVALSLRSRHAEAEACYRRALALDPASPFALSNLGTTLKQLNRTDEAETLLRRALALKPDHPPALKNLAVLLKDAGRLAEAKALSARALAVQPDLDAALQAHLALSPMARSVEDIAAQRADYAKGLEALAAEPRGFSYGGGALNLPWYYLAYQDADDRPLLERTAAVLRTKVGGLDYAAAPLESWRGPGERIRVAFCSEFLRAHTIGRLYRGLIARLDRSRFEVCVLHAAGTPPDGFRADVDRAADRAAELPPAIEDQRRAVEALAADVLIYPEIGMSAQIWMLANARLAPVQAASWGHPNTTGLPSVDYFVSGEAIEPPGADALYSERLVRLGRLPSFYEPPPAGEAAPRAALRLPESGVLYGCPQTLFKVHPDFDAVLAQIAAGDPGGWIVLIGAQAAAWTEVLKARWARTHPILNERVVFLPRLTHEGFMAHLAHIDVLLDPLHFGSGNTLYEAMGEGIPIVTWPGRFMRGRVVAGAYAQMGIEDPPVAATPQAYAEIALALGRDPERRAGLRRELQARARAHLYEDAAAVREFEAFLEAAVAAAAAGERLPSGWRPDAGTPR